MALNSLLHKSIHFKVKYCACCQTNPHSHHPLFTPPECQ